MVWKVTVASLLVAGAVYSLLRWDLASVLDPSAIEGLLASAGALAPLALIGLMAVAVIVSPIPSLPLDVAAGVAFGPWLGTLYAAVGALIGSIVSFGIARALGRELVERIAGGHISFCRECSDKLLTRVVFVSRLIPGLSFDVISYGAGLTKISLRRFALATFFGMLPLTFLYTSFGPLLVGRGWLSLLLGALAVAVFLLLPGWIERYDLFGLRDAFKH